MTRTRTRFARVDIVHVSSAHPWTDNRVHLREAASTVAGGYRTALVAVGNGLPAPETGVICHLLRKRGRLSRVTLGSIEAVVSALRFRPRAVHLHDPELVWSVPVFRRLGVVVIWDAHEDLPDQVLDKHYLSPFQSRVFSAAARLVVRLARSSDAILTATERIAARFPDEKTSVVHNFPRPRAHDGRAPAVVHRPRRVGYIGALGTYRGSEVLPTAIADPRFPDGWTLHVAGSFVPVSTRRPYESLHEAGAVVLHGQVGPDEARDILLDTRVGIVTFLPNAAHLEALPTKMFEYLAAGIPVIASDFPLWRQLLGPHDCATFVDPHCGAAIAEAVRFYDENPDVLARQSRNALRAAREVFSWTSEESVLLEAYRRVGLVPTTHQTPRS
ncbi:glycosyltransferase [Frondihabitans sp. PAMC 28766]|uniref:glycosyltransferase n=1 Tax=Frondihabitans sp. PAMC 28766 TaxID=1795630 RepID=UPI0012FF8932|nr:glycosyltransferase [Frondihabitans sp. PAMC 28766]